MTAPSEVEIRAELALARESLDDAEDDLGDRRLRSATSRAYYAMFHAARAVLWTKGLAPKTHRGLLQLFSEHLVLPGIVEKTLSAMLKDAFDARDLADYDAMTGNLDQADVRRLVKDARRFVATMGDLIRDTPPDASSRGSAA